MELANSFDSDPAHSRDGLQKGLGQRHQQEHIVDMAELQNWVVPLQDALVCYVAYGYLVMSSVAVPHADVPFHYVCPVQEYLGHF